MKPNADEKSRLQRFLDRTQRTISHDLSTPIGTITNYSTVLEEMRVLDAQVVLELSRRICSNAQQLSRMVQSMACAMTLASRAICTTNTDLLALARSILRDAGGRGHVKLADGSALAEVAIDAEIIEFAWRAFVAVQTDGQSGAADAAELSLVRSDGMLLVDLRLPGQEAPQGEARSKSPPQTLREFLTLISGPSRLEAGLGLSLADHLLECHGGTIDVWGQPGEHAGLRIGLPSDD